MRCQLVRQLRVRVGLAMVTAVVLVGSVPAGATAGAVSTATAHDAPSTALSDDGIFTYTRSYCGSVFVTVQARDPSSPTLNAHLPMTIYATEAGHGVTRRQVTILNSGSPLLQGVVRSSTLFTADPSGIGPGAFVEFEWAGGSSSVQTEPYADNCGGSLIPMLPTRVLDTRSGVGRAAGKVPAEQVVEVDLAPALGGRTSGVTSVIANITATNPDTAGYVTAFACGGPTPLASNLNFSAGETVPNLAVVDLVGRTPVGRLCLFTSTTTDLLVDVTGFNVDDSTAVGNGALFTSLTSPQRLADSRSGAPIVAGTSMRVATAGRAGLPATGVVAMALNVTVTEPATGGYLTVYPCDTELPQASNLNFVAGRTRANAAIVAAGTNSDVCVYTSTTAHIIVDAAGSYGPTGFTLWAHSPIRRWDTRQVVEPGESGPRKLPRNASVGLKFTTDWAPGDVVSFNVTITDALSDGFATLYPCAQGVPASSNINFVAGQTIANTVMVRLDADRRACVYSSATTHFILDYSGTYLGSR